MEHYIFLCVYWPCFLLPFFLFLSLPIPLPPFIILILWHGIFCQLTAPLLLFYNIFNSLPTPTIWLQFTPILDTYTICFSSVQSTQNNIPNPPPLHCRKSSSFTYTLPPPFHHEQYHPPSWSYHRFLPFLWNCLAVDMFNLHCPASDLFLSLPPYAAFLCCLKSVTPQCLFILFGMLLTPPYLLPFLFHFNFI